MVRSAGQLRDVMHYQQIVRVVDYTVTGDEDDAVVNLEQAAFFAPLGNFFEEFLWVI